MSGNPGRHADGAAGRVSRFGVAATPLDLFFLCSYPRQFNHKMSRRAKPIRRGGGELCLGQAGFRQGQEAAGAEKAKAEWEMRWSKIVDSREQLCCAAARGRRTRCAPPPPSKIGKQIDAVRGRGTSTGSCCRGGLSLPPCRPRPVVSAPSGLPVTRSGRPAGPSTGTAGPAAAGAAVARGLALRRTPGACARCRLPGR